MVTTWIILFAWIVIEAIWGLHNIDEPLSPRFHLSLFLLVIWTAALSIKFINGW